MRAAVGSGPRRAALAAAAALAGVTAARLPAAWESGNALNHVSGTWLALADDLARGTLYRPIEGDGAYGGTRYFPLVFAVEAGLARAGLPLTPGAGHPQLGAELGAGHPVSANGRGQLQLSAGHAASLGAGLLLVAGIAALLAAGGARRREALAAGVLGLAGLAGQRALADARGDLLPVALSALALAAIARRSCAGRGPRATSDLGVAALLLALAFAAKPTAVSAAAAAVLALVAHGWRRDAAALSAAVATGCAAVVVAIDALSGGRFVAALRSCGAAGLSARTVLAAPARLVREAALEDPAGLALVGLGVGALAAAAPALLRAARARRADPRLVPALWVCAASLTAIAVYAVPGTGVNHLVELEAASASLLAASGLVSAHRGRDAAAMACAAAAAAGVLGAARVWHADRSGSRLAEIRAVVAALPAGPVLSEDPLVPLVAGVSPRVLDPFALRVAAGADPALGGRVEAALRAGTFPAVVLLADADGPGAHGWYARGNLGLSLVAAIRAGYRPAGTVGRYHLYLPRVARLVPDTASGAASGAGHGGTAAPEGGTRTAVPDIAGTPVTPVPDMTSVPDTPVPGRTPVPETAAKAARDAVGRPVPDTRSRSPAALPAKLPASGVVRRDDAR